MESRSLDIGRAVSYMFEEEDWVVKFLLMVGMFLLSLFLIPLFLIWGYTLEITRRVGRDERPALPTWDNWGQYLSQGFMVVLAQVLYSLPLLVPFCCVFFLITALSGSSEQAAEGLAGGLTLLMCCVIFLVLILAIPLALIYYAGLVRYADTGNFGAFFAFGSLGSEVRANLNNYVVAVLVAFLAGLVGGFVPILGSSWTQLVMGHLFGQLLRQRRGGLLTPGMETPVSGL